MWRGGSWPLSGGGFAGAAFDLYPWPRCPLPRGPSCLARLASPAVPPCVRPVKSRSLFRDIRCLASQGFQRSRSTEVQLPYGLNPGAWAPGPQRPDAVPLDPVERPGAAPNRSGKDPASAPCLAVCPWEAGPPLLSLSPLTVITTSSVLTGGPKPHLQPFYE